MQRGPCQAETVYDFAASGITKAVAAGTEVAVLVAVETAADAGAAASAAAGDSVALPSAIAVDMANTWRDLRFMVLRSNGVGDAQWS
jgi:hypothetical protein